MPTDSLTAALAALSAWEALAVAMAIAYLWLAIRQNAWCWPAAIVSTGIYVFLMFGAGLYMESVLQFFYIAIAVFGWYSWRTGRPDGSALRVSTWPPVAHVGAIGLVLGLSAVSGLFLARLTDAAFPFVDSFTTWGAIVTTWMVARKILENWIYWFVIDGLSIWLYVSRGLYLTAMLFGIYLVMIVFGYFAWRRSLREAPA